MEQQIKPKKLIRTKIIQKLQINEWEFIENKDELNKLYALKVREELAEIQESQHNDIMEFVDLIQVATAFANQNGFTRQQLENAMYEKSIKKGDFSNVVLNNLNPSNPSNKLYFDTDNKEIKLVEGKIMKDGRTLFEVTNNGEIKLVSPLSIDAINIVNTANDHVLKVDEQFIKRCFVLSDLTKKP